MQITSYLKTKTVQIAAWIGFLLAYLIASTVFSLAGDYTNDILKARHVLGIGFVLTAVALALIAWRYGQQLKKHNPRNIGRTKVTRKVIYQFLLILLYYDDFPDVLELVNLATHFSVTRKSEGSCFGDRPNAAVEWHLRDCPCSHF
ncbi:MAG: hypothetical protein ABF679_04140 [Lentilactobacillus diolivorans]|uniref:hypothetical protein n=1 Tax=Lentilactobacillus diolivorans TaxID=179838 RepID=UPI0039E94A57